MKNYARLFKRIAAGLVIISAGLLVFRVFETIYMLPINILMISLLFFTLSYQAVVKQNPLQAKRMLTLALFTLVLAILIFILGQIS